MQQQTDAGQEVAAPFRRRVFYIPGYDPIHPRRYRELYRKEGGDQARISGYHLDLKPKTGKGPYGWHVTGRIDGAKVESDIEVLVWADIVKSSMERGILGTYVQLVRTAWAYIGSGALFRLMRLRKGPMIAALYPILFLLVQLAFACLCGWGVGLLVAKLHIALGWVAGLGLIWAMLRAFKRWDNKVFAYYLMHDYAYSAQFKGANPPELEARMAEFRRAIRASLTEGFDEVLVVGHSSGKRWPLVVSAAFTQSLSPERWAELRWQFFRLHFQYLCAFDRPRDYDYFQITAGPKTLRARYAGRAASKSRIETPLSGYRSVA